MKSLVFSTILALALVGSTTVQAGPLDQQFASLEQARPDSPPIEFAQVKSWKSLGHRWASALNEKGEVVAIYDLSYPDLFSRFPFSAIGGRAISKTQIIKMIWDAKVDPNVDQKLADKAINDLQTAEAGPIDDGALPSNWWKQVPWRNVRMAAAGEPNTFRLADINVTALVKQKDLKKFGAAIAQFESALNDSEGSGFGDAFLDRLEFHRTAPGTYDVYVANGARGVSKPRKMADLASPKFEFFNAMKLELAKEAIDKAIDLITVPIVNAIVDTAVDRFFHFHKMVLRTHQHMVLEMLNSMQDGTGTAELTLNERMKAIEALSFAQSSMLTGWKWLWKKPVDEWNKEVKKHQDQAALGLDWLKSHNMQSTQLNPRFAFSLDPATQVKKLLLIAKDKPNSSKGPTAAINYASPETPFRSRLLVEVSTTAVVFGARFIPLVGSYVKKAFKEFVEKPYDKAKIWDGRLTTHLEARDANQYAGDLAILDHQRVNPFFPSRVKMNDLIRQRKQMLGLP